MTRPARQPRPAPEADWMPKALIFDVDGTLAETEALHLEAFNHSFRQAGLGWCWSEDDYRRLLTTTGGKERIARHIREEGGDPDAFPVAALHAAKTAHYGALMAGGIKLRPGIADLIEDASQAGCLLAIATTTTPANVDALCRAAFGRPMARVFHAIAAGDMVRAKKPAPDVYRLALAMIGVGPQDALALEDSRNGLLSAMGAGVACVVSPGAFTQGEDLVEATAVVESFELVSSFERLSGVVRSGR